MKECKFVSLGPGGKDNVTLGTFKALQDADKVYCFGSNSKSYAMDTLLQLEIPEDKICVVELPMLSDRTKAFEIYTELADRILQDTGKIIVATEGDTGIFATTHYVMDILKAKGGNVIQTPGIPSFIAAGALAGISLVSLEQRLLVVPGNISNEEIATQLASGSTLVIMKLSRMKDQIHDFIRKNPQYAYHYVEKVGMPETCHITETSLLSEKDYPYFSLLIIKNN